jgi:hypothetical protein
MLDREDEEVMKEAKKGGCILVTRDRVLREAANGITPEELLEQVQARIPDQRTPEAEAEISSLRSLTRADMMALSESGDKTVESFCQKIEVNEVGAKMVRVLRVKQAYSWRAIARHCSEYLNLPFGGNQLAGMVICDKAAKILGEDYLAPPWN